ncbi:MAG: amino acid dehydrogenase [Alphaproteobacteria bacterium]|nr:amino acid dehydrogenase [Alphaproteobacteria bacterium]MBY0501894.1 amino acid dehydrogenase [Alphaproteobacteria bacterium]
MNISPIKSTGSLEKIIRKDDKIFMENIDVLLNHQYDIHMRIEPQENLIAVVAIDKRSPHPTAFGGTRLSHYSSLSDGIKDAQKLAHAMTYKALFANLPFAGGKVVLFKPPHPIDRESYFSTFGRYIESLNGKMITGCDSGVTQDDMRITAMHTKFISPVVNEGEFDGLSWITALGVRHSMIAGIKFKFNKNEITGLRILIQGIGKVGKFLAKHLKDHGAQVTIADINMKDAIQFAKKYDLEVINPNHIFQREYDILSPCAIGGVVNNKTLSNLKCSIICGAANNVLASPDMDERLHRNGILYIPDFAANVGGAVFAGMNYLGKSLQCAENWIKDNLQNKITEILQYSQKYNIPTEQSVKYLIEKQI